MSESERPRILITDDREENRYVIYRILEGAGFHCIQIGSGMGALEIAQSLPDLIILDVRLPDMSGYEVCQRIKRDPKTSSVPILQISASFTSSEDRARALEGGADAYLTHPIDRLVLIATVRSLLRLRAAESTAKKSAAHWQTTFDALAEGLALIDAKNRLIRWNSAFAEIRGTALDLHAGVDITSLFQELSGTDSPFYLNGHKRSSREIDIGRKTFQLSVNKIESADTEGEKILILADITDRKLAEYALRTAEKLAATGKLANAIAHEINNPLEALTNLIYLATRTESVDSIQEMLTRADSELARIARITRQTLSFHRDTQTPVAIDLGGLVVDIVALFERIAAAHHVRLVCDQKAAPQIKGFPGQISQVIGNLLRNAIEAAPAASEVTIRVRAIRRNAGEGVRLSIHDRGCGIPLDVQRKLFDPFFTTKDLKGSGLGLWVSRSLVVRHGGTIRFRSSSVQRAGTTFEVYLPVGGIDASPSPQDDV
ncbi:MAG TPA: ATP-binding protein [Terracidiphilus sp.]|jgi:two-component system NtrC family sensor kinase|nr:ATP-binding protein [Terracidiphilus sp.]